MRILQEKIWKHIEALKHVLDGGFFQYGRQMLNHRDRCNIALFLPIEICHFVQITLTCIHKHKHASKTACYAKQFSPFTTMLCLDSKSYSKFVKCD